MILVGGSRLRVMIRKALKDDHGQSNIDFLFGVSVFLLTFLYAATFIPGLFVPYQPGAIDLSSVAYRTSAMLAEDPGWYSHAPANGTAWEDNIADLSRIGLADDKNHPNVISLDKINGLNSILANKSNYTIVRDHMGLHGTIEYDIDVSVIMTDTGKELVNMSSWPWQSNYNVESMERNVMVDTGKEMFVDCGKDRANPGSLFTVNITNRDPVIKKNLTIRIFNASGYIDHTINASLDGINFTGMWAYGSEYFYYVNGVYSVSGDVNLNTNDVLEIVILPESLNTWPIQYIRIKGSGSIFGDTSVDVSYNYYQDPEYLQKSVCYPAIMKLEVWSNGLA
jgi:hypothetical protein